MICLGHKKGKRKRERDVVERALGVGLGDGEVFPFKEVFHAELSGRCPLCGSRLKRFRNKDGSGFICPKGDWGASSFGEW